MRLAVISVILLSLLSSGCSWLKFPGVHKVDVQQGNIVDQEMIDKLRPGMTKSQVQFVLGTALVKDTFNQKRWDYFYSRVDSRGTRTEERVTIYFDAEGNLERMTGDYLPSSAIAE
ncbi:outer membrane protein assembly factor BamE [bacterium]|jgi:outer membrane protein assembly factor BamE|nr:outer membrane protein assembly factor BamE [bacterium]